VAIGVLESGNVPGRAPLWSLDAQVVARPARTFRHLATSLPAPGIWTALRRPLLLGIVLSFGISMLIAGSVPARLALTAVITWSYVPVVEVLGLLLVTSRLRDRPPVSVTIDAFFVGHAPVTLFILLVAATMSSMPVELRWSAAIGPGLWLAMFVMAWSAYVDVCFFRYVMRIPARRAAGLAIGWRLFTWTVVFGVFATASSTPLNIPLELVDAVRELTR
jgi:hypothetical protein